MTNSEKSFLGAILNFYERETNKVIAAMAVVKHEYFSCSDGVNIYLSIQNCIRNRLTPDISSVGHNLMNQENQSHGSWLACMREIMTMATSSANVVNYAYVIKAEHDAKQALMLFGQSIDDLNNLSLKPRARIQKALENISSIDVEDSEVKSSYTMKDALSVFIEDLENKNRERGLLTGFENIDKQIQGLQKGNTYPLAGSPGSGKTTLALNITNNALMNNKKVLFYSLEMPTSEIITKLVSLNSKVSTGYLRSEPDPMAERDVKVRIDSAFSKLISKHLIIDEGIGLTAENLDIITKKNELKLGGIDLIVLDYLTLLPAQGESETVKATNAAKALKMISKKYNAPVVILSQFVKNLMGRPKKSDLRQTGQLEQDASAIFLLYRDPENESAEPIIECDIAKNRWGSVGVQNLRANFAINQFVETQEVIAEKPAEEKRKPTSMMDWQSKK